MKGAMPLASGGNLPPKDRNVFHMTWKTLPSWSKQWSVYCTSFCPWWSLFCKTSSPTCSHSALWLDGSTSNPLPVYLEIHQKRKSFPTIYMGAAVLFQSWGGANLLNIITHVFSYCSVIGWQAFLDSIIPIYSIYIHMHTHIKRYIN